MGYITVGAEGAIAPWNSEIWANFPKFRLVLTFKTTLAPSENPYTLLVLIVVYPL